MTRKKRIEYLLVTSILFISVFAFALFGGSEVSGLEMIEDESVRRAVAGGILAYMLTGILSGILHTGWILSRRGLAIKCLAAALWMVTMLMTMALGIVTLLPYALYNLIRIIAMPEEGV